MAGLAQLTLASARMVYRSPESLRLAFLTPLAFAAVVALYTNLRFETDTGSIDFFDYIATGVAFWYVTYLAQHGMTGAAAGYRAQGVLKRLAVTPVTARAFIASQVFARVGLAVVQALAVLGAAWLLGASIEFGPTFAWVLVPVTLIALTGLSIGFIWAGITRTPEGANTLDVMAAIPLLFLAGAMWPRSAYPDLLERIVDYAIPFAPLFDVLRGIALDGDGIGSYGRELLVGGLWLAALFVLATRVYRLQED